jgi:DNA-binding NarL/FixJ family response regulator
MTMPPGNTRVLLADDHPELLQEIQALLSRDFLVLGTAADGLTLVRMAKTFRPDVVVTDIRMPKLSGIDAARTILQQKACEVIILLTVYDDLRLVRSALEAGIRGYVLKAAAGEELIAAIEETLAGRVFVSHHIGLRLRSDGV